MILYPPAKINLGLHILAKRPDGYHEIETIMAQIPLCDILEITENEHDGFKQTGILVPNDGQPNLCERAVNLLREHRAFPKLQIHLRKQIPVGAGLGGGSADASYTLTGVNTLFDLGLSSAELEDFAAQLGSDCAFFIEGGLQLAKGRGELLSKIEPLGKTVHLVLCNPQIHVSTATAYACVQPKNSRTALLETFKTDGVNGLQNDFEASVFESFPAIQDLKNKLYAAGATYAAMSGSGSSVFGIFDAAPVLSADLSSQIIYSGLWCY
ncbi:MAG: 4-(cytidine 5'-diphospho)-2-C-methyl-D-erythritol kinase [Flavobacteriia bacterium]